MVFPKMFRQTIGIMGTKKIDVPISQKKGWSFLESIFPSQMFFRIDLKKKKTLLSPFHSHINWYKTTIFYQDYLASEDGEDFETPLFLGSVGSQQLRPRVRSCCENSYLMIWRICISNIYIHKKWIWFKDARFDIWVLILKNIISNIFLWRTEYVI